MGEEVSKKEESTGSESNLPKFAEMVADLKKENEEAKKILAEYKELMALKIVGGQIDAGVQPKPEVEESPRDYARKLLNRA